MTEKHRYVLTFTSSVPQVLADTDNGSETRLRWGWYPGDIMGAMQVSEDAKDDSYDRLDRSSRRAK